MLALCQVRRQNQRRKKQSAHICERLNLNSIQTFDQMSFKMHISAASPLRFPVLRIFV